MGRQELQHLQQVERGVMGHRAITMHTQLQQLWRDQQQQGSRGYTRQQYRQGLEQGPLRKLKAELDGVAHCFD
jgi:hypothetical protein